MTRFAPLLLGLGLLLAGTADAQTTHTVTLSATSFTPANLTIEQGDTVTWNNSSGFHNVNGSTDSYPDNPESFTSGPPAAAPWTYSFTFDTPGNYDYHCDVHGAPGFGMRGRVTVAPASTDSPLLISEYVEGTSFNKALELYNPSDAPVDLAAGDYSIKVYFNGNPNPGTSVALTGTIAPGDVFVFSEDSADPTILAVADQTFGGALWNGNDAVVLFQGDAVVDAIGQVGFDPGIEWGVDSTSTADNTLRREDDSCTADADTSDTFDPAVNYTGYPLNTFSGLGSHDLDCDGVSGVTVSATGAPNTIPPGGTVTITATVSNNTGSAITIDAWIVVRRGGNVVLTRLFGSGTIPNGATVTRGFPLRAPDTTPPGVYEVTFNVGAFPNTVVASDVFQVTVTPAPQRAGAPAADASAEPFVAEAVAGDLFAASSSAPAGAAVAYPNPARGQAVIRFALLEAAGVRLAVYDALGREVAVLVDGAREAGAHEVVLDARALPAGVYVYRLTVGGTEQSGRLTLVR